MKKEKTRKGGNTKGIITQKMVTFRCDVENVEWLELQVNKGRYINQLIESDRLSKSMNP